MMVVSGNTCFASAAVLASRRLEEPACAAAVSWMEDDPIVRIAFQLLSVIFGGNERLSGYARI